MYIKKITILIGLIFCINQIVAQNIYEKELIKGIQAIFQANFKVGIPLIEKKIAIALKTAMYKNSYLYFLVNDL